MRPWPLRSFQAYGAVRRALSERSDSPLVRRARGSRRSGPAPRLARRALRRPPLDSIRQQVSDRPSRARRRGRQSAPSRWLLRLPLQHALRQSLPEANKARTGARQGLARRASILRRSSLDSTASDPGPTAARARLLQFPRPLAVTRVATSAQASRAPRLPEATLRAIDPVEWLRRKDRG